MHRQFYSKRAFTKALRFFLVSLTMLLLQSCAQKQYVHLAYSPTSVSTVSGSVSVTSFRYLPAETGRVQPFEIPHGAGASLSLVCDQNINVFFRDALFKEMRFVGIRLDDKNRVLGGEIEDLVVDFEGLVGLKCNFKVNYFVKNVKTGKALYESRKTTQRTLERVPGGFPAFLNEIITLNVEELFKDEAFIRAIN